MAENNTGKCSPRTIRNYPVALRFKLKAIAAQHQMSLEALEIELLKHGSKHVNEILKALDK